MDDDQVTPLMTPRDLLAAASSSITVLDSGPDPSYASERAGRPEPTAQGGAPLSDISLGTKPDATKFSMYNRIVAACPSERIERVHAYLCPIRASVVASGIQWH